MQLDKQGLEYLVNLGETRVREIAGLGTYSDRPIHRVFEQTAKPLGTTTLTALVDYIKADMNKSASEKALIHIKSPDAVELISELNIDRKRETYMVCEALTPDNIKFSRFLDVENFNIMLQSSFVDNDHKLLLLQVVGNIRDEAVKQTGDDGISQSVTMKTGVAKVNEVVVPNPVILAPYRTFPEIEQPESKFIFRMKSGPEAALFEADGGAWRNEAMERIQEYLKEQLADYPNISIIA